MPHQQTCLVYNAAAEKQKAPRNELTQLSWTLELLWTLWRVGSTCYGSERAGQFFQHSLRFCTRRCHFAREKLDPGRGAQTS